VEGCNNRRLNELTGDIQTYHAMDGRGYNAKGEPIDKEMAQRLLDRLVAPREISLKEAFSFFFLFGGPLSANPKSIQVGAQVMLIKVSVLRARGLATHLTR